MASFWAKEALQRHLHRLDDIWPLVVVFFGGTAITLCWITIPQVG